MPEKTVLVIDADEDMRSILGEMLRCAGYAPLPAASAAEGVRLLREQRPLLVILEPYAFGPDRWAEIASLHRGQEPGPAPIVAVSTLVLEGAEAGAAGCARFLAKPVSPRAVLGQIEDLLGPAR